MVDVQVGAGGWAGKIIAVVLALKIAAPVQIQAIFVMETIASLPVRLVGSRCVIDAAVPVVWLIQQALLQLLIAITDVPRHRLYVMLPEVPVGAAEDVAVNGVM